MPTPVPPLPTLQKTWQFANNLTPGLTGTNFGDFAGMMLLTINALLGFGANAWTCAGSSDGTTAGMDAVNRLTSVSKIITGGGNHSWIVLQQSAVNPNMQVCIDFGQDLPNNGFINLLWSPVAGFTGGSTSARPTATDEQFSFNAGGQAIQWFNGFTSTNTGVSMRTHVHMSTDGQVTRVFLAIGHQIRSIMFFEKPATPTPGWSNPAVAIMDANPNNPLTVTSMFTQKIQALGPVTTMPMWWAVQTDTFNTTVLWNPWNVPSEWDAHFQMVNIGMYHSATPGQRGRHGYFFDMWLTSTILLTGTSLPANGSKQFVIMGSIAFPWNGGDIEMG